MDDHVHISSLKIGKPRGQGRQIESADDGNSFFRLREIGRDHSTTDDWSEESNGSIMEDIYILGMPSKQ